MSDFNNYKLFKNVGIRSSDNKLIVMNVNKSNNVSFYSSDGGTNNIDVMSINSIINKSQNEDLNLSSLNGTTINPVITINNNHNDCRINTNLNVSGNINVNGNLNIIGNAIINTRLDIGTTGSIVHTNSILDINGQTTIRGHILPSQNEAFDLGNAQYKIRHLFLSNNSLWIGDKHKIDVTDGTIKFRKRKTTAIPTSILAINGGDTEEQIKTYIKDKFGHSENPAISDIKLEEWHTYAQSKQPNIKIEEIFKPGETGDWDENDTTMDKLVIKNNLDVSVNINLTDGIIKTTGIGSFGSITTGVGTFTSIDATSGMIQTTGIGSFGSITTGVGTFTSIYATGGIIKTTGIGSFGSITTGVGTFTSIDSGSGIIKTTGIGSFGSITTGVGTFTSIDSGSGIIKTTGIGSFGSITTGGIQNTNYPSTKLEENGAYGWRMLGNTTTRILALYNPLSTTYYPFLGNNAGGFVVHINGVGDVFNIDTSRNATLYGTLTTTGIGSFGSLTTTGSINTGSGSITTTGQGSFGSINSGSITTTSNITCQSITTNNQNINVGSGTITANTFSGSLSGRSTYSDNVRITNSYSSASVHYIPFTSGYSTADYQLRSDNNLTYEPIDNSLSVGRIWCTGTGSHPNYFGGKVGIMTFPAYGFHLGASAHIGPATSGPNVGTRYTSGGHSWATGGTYGNNIGAKFELAIWVTPTNGVTVSSDSRIKTNIVDVPDNLALQQLRSIPCRYYEYIDKITRGSDKTIGFIAQEVKAVMPMAVSLQKEIIPNVYKVINCIWTSNGNKFNMSSTDLPNVSGVKYKFYVSNASDASDTTEKEIDIEIIGNSDDTFTFDAQYTNVFCYGSEVDDFHTLTKSKLFTLNFSASQELDRIQQTHITEIALLKSEVSTLETENQQQQTKMNELTSIIDKLKTANSFEEFKQTF